MDKKNKQNDLPFEPDSKKTGNVVDKSGAVHTPMSRARHLARMALKKTVTKPVNEVSSELLDRYKEKAKVSADALTSMGKHRKSTDRWANIMKATGKQIEKTTFNIKKALKKEEVSLVNEVSSDLVKKARDAAFAKGKEDQAHRFVSKAYQKSKKESDAMAKKMNEQEMEGEDPCWKNYKMVGHKTKNGKKVPNCVPESTTMSFKGYLKETCDCEPEEDYIYETWSWDDWCAEVQFVAEANNENRQLNKPFRTPGGPKKFAVYVKNDKGNVIKLGFGDPNLEIKRDDPERRKAYRARHNCDNPGPKWKANWWSCNWSWNASKKVGA